MSLFVPSAPDITLRLRLGDVVASSRTLNPKPSRGTSAFRPAARICLRVQARQGSCGANASQAGLARADFRVSSPVRRR